MKNLLIIIVGLIVFMTSCQKTKKPDQNTAPEKITISQLRMEESYGWKRVILWMETKENFEKAYGVQLHWTDYKLILKRNPQLSNPFGEVSDWQYEKVQFYYEYEWNMDDQLEKIAEKSKGKSLVIIGSLFNNGTEFVGNAYWCENKD